jgi:predicted dehydrogenase
VSRRLRAGVIGLGVGERHIHGFRKHPQCEVVALCDIDPEKKAMAAERYPDIRFFDQAETLIRSDEVDIVCIASFDNDHHAQVMLSLELGKHVFVEKPLCLYEEEFQDIRRLAARRPELAMGSNLILRRAPRFAWLRQAIAEGRLGRLYHLEGDYLYGRLHKLTEGWRGRIPYYSVVHGGAIHLLDLMTWLSGSAVTEVQAMGVGLCTEGTQFRGPDMVAALLRFDNGAMGKVSANFSCVYPHFHQLQVYGSEASFLQTSREAGLLYRSRDPQQPPEPITAAYPGAEKGDLLYSFVESILGHGPSEITRAEMFQSMASCLAITRSLATGEKVTVADLLPPIDGQP